MRNKQAHRIHTVHQRRKTLNKNALRGARAVYTRPTLNFRRPERDHFRIAKFPPVPCRIEALYDLVVGIDIIIGTATGAETDCPAARLAKDGQNLIDCAGMSHAMLKSHARIRRNPVKLLRYHTGDLRNGILRERDPGLHQRSIIRHCRIEGRARPFPAGGGIEIGDAAFAPAAGPGTRSGRSMIVKAQIIVNPHISRLELRIKPCHGTHVLEKTALARTIAGFRLHSGRSGPSGPFFRRAVFSQGKAVAVSKRRLKLEAGHDAKRPKLFGRPHHSGSAVGMNPDRRNSNTGG